MNRNSPTITYRKFGTSSNVDWCNGGGILPGEQFSGGDAMNQRKTFQEKPCRSAIRPVHHTCKPCTILCGHKGTLADGSVHTVPEYETVGLLGPNLGIYDPDQHRCEWNDLCGRTGHGYHFNVGAVLGWVMEAGEKGLLRTPPSASGLRKVSGKLSWIWPMGKGFGQEMARGTRWLSEQIRRSGVCQCTSRGWRWPPMIPGDPGGKG